METCDPDRVLKPPGKTEIGGAVRNHSGVLLQNIPFTEESTTLRHIFELSGGITAVSNREACA